MKIKTEIDVEYDEPPPPEEREPWYLNPPVAALFVFLSSIISFIIMDVSMESAFDDSWRLASFLSVIANIFYFAIAWAVASSQSNSVYTYVSGDKCKIISIVTSLVLFLSPLLIAYIDYISKAIVLIIVLLVVGAVLGMLDT